MFTVPKLIEKARAQAEGMKELGPHLSTGAPFTAAEMAREAGALEAKRAVQQAAERAFHAATADVRQHAKVLNAAYARNVRFFEGRLGETDTRLPRVGGRVPKKRPKRLKKTASTTPTPNPGVKTP
jgi:hypothetical protein